jgi:N-acetylglucosaminyldiphosphoundecaprenol N-acetyl-beta-D-mannosaminyltransferase
MRLIPARERQPRRRPLAIHLDTAQVNEAPNPRLGARVGQPFGAVGIRLHVKIRLAALVADHMGPRRQVRYAFHTIERRPPIRSPADVGDDGGFRRMSRLPSLRTHHRAYAVTPLRQQLAQSQTHEAGRSGDEHPPQDSEGPTARTLKLYSCVKSLAVNMLNHIDILGYSVLDEPVARVAAAVCDGLNRNHPKSFVFLNPHSVVIAEHEPAFRSAIVNADGIFCDGVGLSLAGLLLNRRRAIRVYGFEFFLALSRELSARRMGRVFFLGGTDESLADLVGKYRAEFPGIPEIGAYAPPYREEFGRAEIEHMAREVASYRADVLWIGLGSPKQEKVLLELMQLCDLSCGAAIGAVFDFYTGRIPHAPAWIRRMGLQWAHRLVLEPKRLWKRTLISSPLFLWLVFRRLLNLPRTPR